MKSIKNYQQAIEFLGGKKERPYAHNTRIEFDSLDMGHEVVTVKYHGNPVVNFFPNGTNTYSSCGWQTMTTKERINWFLPDGFYLYQQNSMWFIQKRGNGSAWVFADGIAIDSNGNVYNDAGEGTQDETKKTLKAIKKYVNDYVTALLNGEIESPSGGDCWYCVMVTDKGQSLGEATNNTDHIYSHFDESYFVPSLLVNAEKFNHRMSDLTKDGIARLWQKETISGWQASIVERDVKSCLTAYLKHVLGIAQ